MTPARTRCARLLLALLLPLSYAVPAVAQLAPPSTGGAAATMHDLGRLGHYERVLMIGAHPDDEDTELLALLSRGMGARVAYLALTRGEGGQDLIGPELGDALGVLRTEELLAARRIDGAQQFFSRAYDFGFSKTLDDAWKHWPQDSVLKDVVRIIRRFRPQVVVSVFSGTPRDGHGQHQAAGWAARRAFDLAGDPAAFPELATEEHLAPWTPLKLYRSARFNTTGLSLTLDGGAIDPATGKTFRQLAMEGRSLHRSQKMGQLQPIGPSTIGLALWADRTGQGGAGFWAGVDTGLAALPAVRSLPARQRAPVASALERYQRGIDSLRRAFPYGTPAAAVPALTRLGALLRSAAVVVPGDLAPEVETFGALYLRAQGVVFDAIADRDLVAPGESLGVTLVVRNGAAAPLDVRTQVAPGLSRDTSALQVTVAPGAVETRTERVAVPADAPVSRPYFLEAPRDGWLYHWPSDHRAEWGQPFAPRRAQVLWSVTTPAGTYTDSLDLAERLDDPAFGELRRPVFVAPRIGVAIAPDQVLVPAGNGAVSVTVTLDHEAADSTSGSVRLDVPAGWARPPVRPFAFGRAGESRAFVFDVRPPADARAGEFTLHAVATDARGTEYRRQVVRVDYPHIRARQFTVPADARIVVADVTLPPVRAVGYVRGAADHIPEALAAAGLPVTVLDSATLAGGDLSRFDAIVVGPRAYEVDTTLLAHNDRLLAYARNGGRVVVQYQQQVFFAGGYAPYPLSLGGRNDRTTDETAVVTALAPDAPDLRAPNPIGAADWDGWLQERSLYCAHTWDSAYQPIVAMADPGEAPISGCLLEARVGRGSWAYTALAFHRQLPGAVPGAFRLFLNLIGARPLP